ncbi:MAG: universal stress protein [Nitrospiraceae bacterium]|nr:MAG: universal stress protein [Nitrospiraceae bacterium]
MSAKTDQYTQEELLEMIRRWVPAERMPRRVRIKDTSDFFRVDYDDVVVLKGIPYLVRNNEREGRFGISDEQKFWVKRAIDLISGKAKILKWAFREEFHSRVGDLVFECVRSPRKESRILDMVRGRPDFMQGETVQDATDNPLRIMDYIRGRTLEDVTLSLGRGHEDFFSNHFPSLLSDFIASVQAIGFLHDNDEKHGDIRRDHLIRDKTTGQYRWIDFDYNYRHGASRFGYDLFGLGNVLIFITGRGDVTTRGLMMQSPGLFDKLVEEDLNIVFNTRVANLQKVYPYIPDELNRVLMHFSTGARVYYDNTSQLLEDLGEVLEMIEVKKKPMHTMNNQTDDRIKDKHLLISVDESEEAKHAVLYVADFVGGFPGFRATLLSIVQDPGEDFFASKQEKAEWIKKETESMRQTLENYRQILIQSGFPEDKVAMEICADDSKSLSKTILSFQCDMSCCTVVVGRKHKSKTEEFLFGSVSNQLIHEARNCAVWVVE